MPELAPDDPGSRIPPLHREFRDERRPAPAGPQIAAGAAPGPLRDSRPPVTETGPPSLNSNHATNGVPQAVEPPRQPVNASPAPAPWSRLRCPHPRPAAKRPARSPSRPGRRPPGRGPTGRAGKEGNWQRLTPAGSRPQPAGIERRSSRRPKSGHAGGMWLCCQRLEHRCRLRTKWAVRADAGR